MLIICNTHKCFHASIVLTKANSKGKLLSIRKLDFICKTATIERSFSILEKFFYNKITGQITKLEDVKTINLPNTEEKTFKTNKIALTGTPLRTIYYSTLIVYKTKIWTNDDPRLIILK